MSPASQHLSDEQLLRVLDGEQTMPQLALSHLAVCAACRERRQQLAAAGNSIRHLLRDGLPLPPAEEARLRLQQAMQTAAAAQRSSSHMARWSYAAAAMLLLSAGIALVAHRAATPVQAAEIPDSRLTPGMIRPVALADVCNAASGDDQDPAVTPEVQRAVLRAYGLDPERATEYQIDYLINPQLGGTADVRNLWPEPYRASAWNARAKDALESRMHKMVCTGQLDLTEAQRELATDWIAAYKKYFQATQPLS